MSADDIPPGLPFSLAYLKPTSPLKDSERFRVRLAAAFGQMNTSNSNFAQILKLRRGIEVRPGYEGYLWDRFFKDAPLKDLLDAIGLFYETARRRISITAADNWKRFVQLALREEAMGYRLDDECAVRLLVDEEFSRSSNATIKCLGLPRYASALAFQKDALGALEGDPIDTRGAVRNAFEAVEEVFKLMYGVDRLVPGQVRNHFKPETAFTELHSKAAATEMGRSFACWVVACQQYRHAPGREVEGGEIPGVPPLELAVALISQAMNFLRWLIDIDQRS